MFIYLFDEIKLNHVISVLLLFWSLHNGFPARDILQYRLVKLYEALEIQVLYALFIPYLPQASCLEI